MKAVFVVAAFAWVTGQQPRYCDRPVEFWIEALRDPQSEVGAFEATMALWHLAPHAAGAVPILVQFVKERKNDALDRSTAVKALGEIGPPARSAAPLLIAMIQDNDPRDDIATRDFRADCDEALVRIESDGRLSIPVLVSLLADKSRSVRRSAANSLAVYGSKAAGAAPVLAERLVDEDEWVREEVVRALVAIGQPARSILEANLQSKQGLARVYAAMALIHVEPTNHAALNVLLRGLEDDNADVRSAAASAIGEIGAAIRPVTMRKTDRQFGMRFMRNALTAHAQFLVGRLGMNAPRKSSSKRCRPRASKALKRIELRPI